MQRLNLKVLIVAVALFSVSCSDSRAPPVELTDYALQTVDHHHLPLFLGTGYRIGLGHDSIPAEVWMLSATLHLGTPESLDNFWIDARMFNVLLPTGDTVAFPGGGWGRYYIMGNEIRFFDDMHTGKVITLSRGRTTRDGRLQVTGTIQRHSPTES
jgi:hypothetical protein